MGLSTHHINKSATLAVLHLIKTVVIEWGRAHISSADLQIYSNFQDYFYVWGLGHRPNDSWRMEPCGSLATLWLAWDMGVAPLNVWVVLKSKLEEN